MHIQITKIKKKSKNNNKMPKQIYKDDNTHFLFVVN